MTRVLVTDGASSSSRTTLSTVRALRAGGHEPWVTTVGGPSLASVSRDRAGVVPTPPADDPGYPAAVAAAVRRLGAVAVLCTSDVSLIALGHPGRGLLDKDEMARRAAAAGLPTITGRVLGAEADARAAAGGLDYPVVVKTLDRTQGQDPVTRVDGPEELLGGATPLPLLVQPFVDAPLSAVCGVVHAGRVVAVVAQEASRLWPPQIGVSSFATSVPPDPARVAALERLLAGHEGVFQAQFLGDALIDVNPRPYGSLPLALRAGLNLPAIAVDAALGRLDPTAAPLVGEPGRTYRWLEGDLRHLLAGVRERSLGPRAVAAALRPRRGTAHSILSLRDPRPALLRATAVARGLRHR